MARARNIKPGFFKNEDLGECALATRLCFAGLWTLADRDGRLEDRPKRIKGEIFAFDDFNVEPLLDELAQHGFIVRYESDGQRFIQITKFATHQTPHYSEKQSVIKPPPFLECTPDEGAHIPGNSPSLSSEAHRPLPGESTEAAIDDDGKTPRKMASSRGGRNPLNPDSLNPSSLNPEKTPSPAARAKGSALPAGFDAFWTAYPRKTAKPDAVKAFVKLQPDADLLAAMLNALAEQSKGEQWRKDDGQFIPHPATWINKRRWEDESNSARAGWSTQGRNEAGAAFDFEGVR